ncbi:unnamed protein product [Cochlearia groenlandica]
MEKNPCDTNQLDCDSHLPPRKRLLAGFKKLNNGSSSSSTSNGSSSSSSASTDVQTHLNNLLSSSSRFNHNQSPEMLVEATRSAAVLAVKAAKTARAIANEKALVSAKAIAAAKRALELVDSFPKESISPKKNNNKQKKHVPVEFLYSKDQEEDLARRLNRGVDRKAEENCERNKKKQKKNKSIVIGSMNDNDGNLDSDSSYERLELNRKANKPDKEEGKESNALCKRRVKLKKIPLSNCNSRDQENRISSTSPLQTVAQLREEADGVVTVINGSSSSQKCQDIKAQECVKQSKAVRSL